MKYPEFLRLGWKILFHDGKTRGMGEVTRLFKPDGMRTDPNSGNLPNR